MKRFSTTFFSFIYFSLFSTNLAAQNTFNSQLDSLFKLDNPAGSPGCAVAVVKDGSVVFKKGYGMANLEYDIPITPSTIFDIASVSKQFTGLAISMLSQQGKIALNDDVRKYLPDLPNFGKVITIRHLLHHTSGLRDWPETLAYAGWRENDPILFEDIMRMLRNQKELDFLPGERYAYSNTGYNVLAAIVEKVSGKPFAQWTQENIFVPLQMNSSYFLDDPNKIVRNLAYSYAFDGKEFKKAVSPLTAYGSSSLFTSLDDLCKWSIHFNRQISAGNPIYANMLTEGTLNNGAKVVYGYGLETGKDRSLKISSHTGSWAGYRTSITTYLQENLSIILLSNSGDFNVKAYSSAVANFFLKDKLIPDLKASDKIREAPGIVLDTVLAKKIVGNYFLIPGKAVTLTLENGQLMTQATGEPKFPTEAKSDSTLWIDAYQASMVFLRDKKGEINSFRYKNILAKRIDLWTPTPAILDQFAGTYYSDELFTEYRIIRVNNTLKSYHARHGDIPLAVDMTCTDCFQGDFGFIRFFRDTHKKVTGFNVSGSRVKNITFYKKPESK